MEIQDFAERYQNKTNEELLQLARALEQLAPEASIALANELRRRGIDGADRLKAFSEEEDRYKREKENNPGAFFFFYHLGIGRKRFGKAERSYNSETGIERFKTTVFVILFWFPLIPTGSYVVERKRGFFSNQIKILERLPLAWEQVLQVWVVASAGLLVLILTLKHLPSILFGR